MAGFYAVQLGDAQDFNLTANIPDFDALCSVNNVGERRPCQTFVPAMGSKDSFWSNVPHGKREDSRGKRSTYKNSDLCDSDDLVSVRRERNKIAANKCRQKKKEHAEKIRKEFERLQGRHSTLKSVVEELHRERQRLFHMLETHRPTCCRPIDGAAAHLDTHVL